jgi:hypothetical protein
VRFDGKKVPPVLFWRIIMSGRYYSEQVFFVNNKKCLKELASFW